MSHLSETPETDAAALHDGTVVSADVARQLERQRNEAQADRDHLITVSRDRLEKIRQLEREIEGLSPSKLPPLS